MLQKFSYGAHHNIMKDNNSRLFRDIKGISFCFEDREIGYKFLEWGNYTEAVRTFLKDDVISP